MERRKEEERKESTDKLLALRDKDEVLVVLLLFLRLERHVEAHFHPGRDLPVFELLPLLGGAGAGHAEHLRLQGLHLEPPSHRVVVAQVQLGLVGAELLVLAENHLHGIRLEQRLVNVHDGVDVLRVVFQVQKLHDLGRRAVDRFGLPVLEDLHQSARRQNGTVVHARLRVVFWVLLVRHRRAFACGWLGGLHSVGKVATTVGDGIWRGVRS
jgi:hypothetical protein